MIVTFSKKRIYLSSLLYHFVKSTEIYLKWERFQRKLFTACGVIMNLKNYYKISVPLTLLFEKSESKETSAMAVSAESIFSKDTKPTLKQNIKETLITHWGFF